MPSLPTEATSWATDLPVVGILVGFGALVAGASMLVRGAVWVALVLGLSRMTVGLTLVAFGTSLPELVVSLTSAFKGNNDMALANVLGSNLMNVLLILGITAAICPIALKVKRFELQHLLWSAGLLVVPFVLVTDLTRPLALVMFLHVLLFCWLLLRRERRTRAYAGRDEQQPSGTAAGWVVHIAMLLIGLALLRFGADWLVDGAIVTAESLGMSDHLIGLTILAGGTSLPELATSAMAARRGHPEIAIGNVLGSNIFNVGSVLGMCGLIHPLTIDHGALLPLLIVTTAASVWLAIVLHARGRIGRGTAAAFLLVYAGYVVFEALR